MSPHRNTSTIRVAFASSPPDSFTNCQNFPTYQPSIECLFPGWTVEILRTITEALKIEIVPVFIDNQIGELNWGQLKGDPMLQGNGTWEGALSLLQNDTVDTLCLMFQQTIARMAYFEYSYPVTNIQPIYAVKERDYSADASYWDLFKPYRPEMWYLFAGSIFLQFFIFTFISFVGKSVQLREKYSFWETMWNVSAYQLGNLSQLFAFHTWAGRLLLWFFGMGYVVLFFGLYESYLITALLTPEDPYPFKDARGMAALIEHGSYKFVKDQSGLWFYEDLETSSTYADLKKALVHNPAINVKSTKEALDLVERGGYVYALQEDDVASLLVEERCGMLRIGKALPQKSAHFVFQRNSPFAKLFNKQIIQQQSFILRTYTKYFESGFKLSNSKNCAVKSTVYRPLGVTECVGLFVVIVFGTIVSSLATIVEWLMFSKKKIHDRLFQRSG